MSKKVGETEAERSWELERDPDGQGNFPPGSGRL